MGKSARGLLRLAAAVAWLLGAPCASAHPLAPALLELRASEAGGFEVLWRLPQMRALGMTPTVRLPESCRAAEPLREAITAKGIERRWSVVCDPQALADESIELEGLTAPMSAVVRVVFEDGRTIDGLLTADRSRFHLSAAAGRFAVARSYIRFGLEHIATGPDHLLFVFGLVLLASTWRRVLVTVTAFTLGHSVTLALAALGLLVVPSGPVELAIAVSVLIVAVEAARGTDARTPAVGHPWTIAAGFGLLHGLGFASAMNEAGLAAGALLLALFSFNVGIELGQIAFVALVLVLALPARRLSKYLPIWALRVPVYCMGTIAAYWCFERAASWLFAGG